MPAINFLEFMDHAPFPMTKPEIVAWCESHGASEDALDIIQALPSDAYDNFAKFSHEIGLIETLPGARENMFSSSQRK